MKIITDSKCKNLIGKQVKIARVVNNITQQQLSNKLEEFNIIIDRTSISKIEAQTRFVTDYELLAISKALEVSINWLLNL